MADPRVRRHIRRLEPLPSTHAARGRLEGPVQAVLFDIYGTLFISGCGDIGISSENPPLASILDEMLRHYGLRASPEDLTQGLHQAVRSEHQRKRADGLLTPEIDIVAIWQQVLKCPDVGRVRAFALEYE